MTLGTLGALYTLVWSVLVALGLGSWSVVTKTHLLFLNNPFSVTSFNLTNAVVLIIGSFVGMYIFGWIFAYVYDMYGK